MSDRDRQSSYDRNQQYGSGQRGSEGYDSPRQANQWQSDSYRQQGGDWQQDAGHRNEDDYARDSRYSSQGGGQGYGTQSYGERSYNRGGSQDFDRGGSQGYGSNRSQSYRSQLNDDDLRNDQREASRNYSQARGGYGQSDYRSQNRNWQQGSSYAQRNSNMAGYAGRDYDASGGNDFGSFTSEDFGGRDFSNRGGGLSGGMRSSESYRPSYGLSSWTRGNDDNDGRLGRYEQGRSGREDYGRWREYGESRGFLAKAGDEIASWFGDEDASRRRDQDHRQDQRDNRAQGNYQSHRGRGPSDYTRSDERIREDANDHLTHDHDVDATHITVSVKDGELTLNGTVENRQAKRRAEDCVEHISGVKHVQNNLRVQDRSSSTSSYGSSGGASTGGTYGSTTYGSNAGENSSLTGQGSATSATGTGAGASVTTGSNTTAAGSTSSGTTGSGTAATSSTSGIGSAAPAGSSTTAATRQGEKTS